MGWVTFPSCSMQVMPWQMLVTVAILVWHSAELTNGTTQSTTSDCQHELEHPGHSDINLTNSHNYSSKTQANVRYPPYQHGIGNLTYLQQGSNLSYASQLLYDKHATNIHNGTSKMNVSYLSHQLHEVLMKYNI